MEELSAIHKAVGGVWSDGGHVLCPMRGKRALELSLGAIENTCEALSTSLCTDLLEACSDLPDGRLGELLTDWTHAKSFIEIQIRTKVSFWQLLPWSLVRLADWDAARARRNCAALVTEFDAAVQESTLHHPLTVKLLAQGSQLREQVLAFRDGADLSSQTMLEAEVMPLLFIPVVERCIEGEHGRANKHAVYRAVTGGYVSFCLRSNECEDWLKSRIDRDTFFRTMSSVRRPKHLAHRFGFHRHPLWQEILRKTGGRREAQLRQGSALHHVFYRSKRQILEE